MALSAKKRFWIRHLLFLLASGLILAVLFMAPPESTPPLPHNPAHALFINMPKKEAEQRCASCHSADKIAPLPKNHPSAYRCLFCHKKEALSPSQTQTKAGG